MIEEIRKKIQDGNFELSKHDLDQSIIRQVNVQEMIEIILHGEIIEEYPEDKYGASCLIYGKTRTGRILHIQCSYPSRHLIKIITMYEPELDRWIDYKERK